MAIQETKVVNAFETTLDGAVAAGDSSIDLTDDPGVTYPCYLVIDPDNDSKRELVLWTSGAFGAAVVTRDVDAIHDPNPAHADGTTVRLAVVKQHIEDLHDRVDAVALTGNVTGTLAAGTSAIDTTLVLNDVAAADVNVANDSIAIIDADGSNATKKESIAHLVTAMATTGIGASSGTLVNNAIGKQSMWIPAAAMYPTQTAGCADIAGLDSGGNSGPDLYTLDFAGSSANEHAQFSIAFPSYWNESTVTFQAYWTTEATDTDGVVWELKAVGFADSGDLNQAFHTAIHVDDACSGTAKDLHITTESAAVTVGGSPAAGELCYFNVSRLQDDSNDTATEDAKLIGIKLFYTVDDVHEA